MIIARQYPGNFANNLFVDILCRLLSLKLQQNYVCGSALIKYFTDLPHTVYINSDSMDFINLKEIEEYSEIFEILNNNHIGIEFEKNNVTLKIDKYYQNINFFINYVDKIKEMFSNTIKNRSVLNEKNMVDVAVGVRLGDFKLGNVLLFDYYETVLENMDYRYIQIITDEPFHDYFKKTFLKKYSNKVKFDYSFDDENRDKTMFTVSKFNKIILCMSTFHWFSAFLSDAAHIYMPNCKKHCWEMENKLHDFYLRLPNSILYPAEILTMDKFKELYGN